MGLYWKSSKAIQYLCMRKSLKFKLYSLNIYPRVALFWCFLEIMREEQWMNHYLWMSHPSVSDLFNESIIQFTNESFLTQKLSGLLRLSLNNGLIPHKTTETTLRIINVLYSPHDVKTLFCGPPEAWKLQSPFCRSLFPQRHDILKKVISQIRFFFHNFEFSRLRKKSS